jgi:hypothetical protein
LFCDGAIKVFFRDKLFADGFGQSFHLRFGLLLRHTSGPKFLDVFQRIHDVTHKRNLSRFVMHVKRGGGIWDGHGLRMRNEQNAKDPFSLGATKAVIAGPDRGVLDEPVGNFQVL